MVKNVTPKQIAFYASLSISSIITLFAFLGMLSGIVDINVGQLLVLTILTFISSYFIIINSLKRYIYRKIKLIYKSIHSSKRSAKDKNVVDLNQDIIGEVEQEVADWANSREQEIESLKSMEQYRRNFMGDISHELKTPIFSIQGYLHTLLDGALYDKNINESYIRKAARNVDRLQTIVEDLEAISRLESGELVLEIRDFDLKALCEEIFEELELLATQRNISLLFKDGASGSFNVKADRDSIRQVLVNLVSNSIKYGNEGGRTKISFYDMDNVILVEIADDGIGIGEDHQGGSGLGLSIVKHIIEAHKQTINVRSTEHEGSTFGFTLEKC